MKTPMVLPWLARRAGVSDGRAEELWLAACRQAALMTGEQDTPCYWGAVQQILLDLLENERWQACALFAWPWLLMHGSLRHYCLLARRWRMSCGAAAPMLALPWSLLLTCRLAGASQPR